MSQTKVDTKKMMELREHAADIKPIYSKLHEDFTEYENIFHLKWGETEKRQLRDGTVITISPDARNKVLNATRLMLPTDPQFSVTTANENVDKDKIEKDLTRWWKNSGKIKKRPIHFDALLSAVLYGRIDNAITPMADLIKRTTKHKQRIERIARMTPYLVENWNPHSGYPEYDIAGLTAYYRETKVSHSYLVNTFGDLLPNDMKQKHGTGQLTLSTFYDLDYAAFWVEGHDIWIGLHGFPEIPISCTQVDGSGLFDKPEEQTQPMLYSIYKSGIWKAQNLSMTILYTTIFGLGASPMFIHTAPDSDESKKLELNFDVAGGVVELSPGEKIEPMGNKGLIDPAFMEGMNLASSKLEESTIHSQAFGAPMNRQTTFSEFSLLNQSGRLPLIGPQRMGGAAIAEVARLMLMMAKTDGAEALAFAGSTLKPEEIPDDLDVEVKLDVSLPQDRLQLANIAVMLKNTGLADDEWIQENILNIQNTEEMRKKVWTQQAEQAMVNTFIQTEMQKQAQEQAAEQKAAQDKALADAQAAAQADAQGQPPPGQPGQTPTPDMLANPQMAGGQGQRVQGGLPPQMAGMIPGGGQGQMPPGGMNG
ncbi:MAG: hypothetical protein ABFD24_06115 [Anaerolineaceae bacterium]